MIFATCKCEETRKKLEQNVKVVKKTESNFDKLLVVNKKNSIITLKLDLVNRFEFHPKIIEFC